MSRSQETVALEVTVVKVTDAAVLVEIEGTKQWVPQSQIESDWPEEGEDGEIEVTQWFAEKAGLA